MPATDRLHSPTPEDLMAYLDGEAPAGAGQDIQSHLANCSECQAVVADLRGVSREVNAWAVVDAPDALRSPHVPGATRWTLPAFSWRPAYLTLSLGTVAVTVFLGLSTLVRLPKQARVDTPLSLPVGKATDSVSIL